MTEPFQEITKKRLCISKRNPAESSKLENVQPRRPGNELRHSQTTAILKHLIHSYLIIKKKGGGWGLHLAHNGGLKEILQSQNFKSISKKKFRLQRNGGKKKIHKTVSQHGPIFRRLARTLSLGDQIGSNFLSGALSELRAHFYLAPLHGGYLNVFFPFIAVQSCIEIG